jgi:glyoxylase I family protein
VINSVVHHFGIGLRYPKQAEPFFDTLLVDYLGMAKEKVWESVAGWKGRGTRIYLYPVREGSPPGALQHLAFTARNRREVEDFPKWAQSRGFDIIDSPREYPRYGRDYYAVFFRGPENLKLELVYLSEPDHAEPL